MLFNSYEFILLFLPITLIFFFVIGERGYHRAAVGWLVGASLFFYGWWKLEYLVIILFSILLNYGLGFMIERSWNQNDNYFYKLFHKKVVLVLGVSVNLCVLGYFKYTNFIVDNITFLTGNTFHLNTIIFPLGISFFTFQQITYLVDIYKEGKRDNDFLSYVLFVSFFPKIIAGPIVLYKEVMPQFAKKVFCKFNNENFAVGTTIFIIGLFNKVVLADQIALYATPVFNAAEQGSQITFFEAWGGACAYTLQIYFDFSGYSNMAIGVARMVGVSLPLNFYSPYKAVNIIEFWRRWHITLSRFLKDYLYIPLGGNRKGKFRTHLNLMITMLLGGLWHGAGWTFVLWGMLHGLYLVINNLWRLLRQAMGFDITSTSYLGRGLSRLVTFTAVVVAWVFFRAQSYDGAIAILHGMAGFNGVVLDSRLAGMLSVFDSVITFKGIGIGAFGSVYGALWIVALLIISFFAPNAQQLLIKYKPSLEIYRGKIHEGWVARYQWRPSAVSGFIVSIILIYVLSKITSINEFLYVQF